MGQGVDPHRKAGLLVRGSLDEDSPYADAVVHGDGLTSLQSRREKGGLTEQIVSAVKGADFLQLERRGNRFTMSAARFGEPLATSVLEELPLGDEVYVGLFLCSHNVDVVEQAIFRDVRIIRPAKADFTPYRDYIGSVLEILDVETGRRQVVRRSAEPFEAPELDDATAARSSTTAAGAPRARGRLHRFDLATRQSTVIDTGFAIRNNNDHVLSFDGRMLAISDQSQDEGRSTVYTLPTGGGTPRRITPLTPSYLHGWSPDGRWLVYTGGRNGEFDIYKRASDGSGEEVRLTDFKGLDDGPEYSPDGTLRLLQLGPQREDAALAHEAGRQGPGAGHERRVQQLVPAPLAGREADRVPELRQRRRSGRAPVLQARHAPADAGRGRRAARDRVRLRRAGHDQRAVVVARRADAGVRQQQRHLLSTDCALLSQRRLECDAGSCARSLGRR